MEAKFGFFGHVLMKNRSGLVVDAELTRAYGHAERLASLAMVDRLATRERTLGADRGYDTKDLVGELRERWITPHLAQAHTRYRGLERARWSFTFAAAAYNLIRRAKLLAGRG